jgi:hypothetical protein
MRHKRYFSSLHFAAKVAEIPPESHRGLPLRQDICFNLLYLYSDSGSAMNLEAGPLFGTDIAHFWGYLCKVRVAEYCVGIVNLKDRVQEVSFL